MRYSDVTHSIVRQLKSYAKDLGKKELSFIDQFLDYLIAYQKTGKMASNDLLNQVIEKIEHEQTPHTLESFFEAYLDLYAQEGEELQDFTASSLVELMVHLLDPSHEGSICDPACGQGGMLIRSNQYASKHGASLRLMGFEKVSPYLQRTTKRAELHQVTWQSKPLNEDVYQSKWGGEHAGQYDYVISNPPYNDTLAKGGKYASETCLPFGLPPSKTAPNANLLWLQYSYALMNEGGRAVVLQPNSSLMISKPDEVFLFENFIKEDILEAVISVSSGLFYSTGIGASIWILNRNKPTHQKNKVLLCDFSSLSRALTRAKQYIPQENVEVAQLLFWLYRGETERASTYIRDLRSKVDHAISQTSILNDQGLDSIESTLTRHESLKLDVPDQQETHRLIKFNKLVQRQFKRMLYALESWDQSATLEKIQQDLIEIKAASQEFSKQYTACIQRCKSLAERNNQSEMLRVLHDEESQIKEIVDELLISIETLSWVSESFPEGEYKDVLGLCKALSYGDLVEGGEEEEEEEEEEESSKKKKKSKSKSKANSLSYRLSPMALVGQKTREDDDLTTFAEKFDTLYQRLVSQRKESERLSQEIKKQLSPLHQELCGNLDF